MRREEERRWERTEGEKNKRTPPDHHPSFWIVQPLPSDTSLISLCHVCLENPASSGHSTSRGPSEYLTESTSSLTNTQTAKSFLNSPRTGLFSAALASSSTCLPAPSTCLPPVFVRTSSKARPPTSFPTGVRNGRVRNENGSVRN
ncbi:hypothetical protein E2C01_011227 [Portunus trituberculatus]|uniref:Uncharacterized protein n=1 Tax=Portunus trituberculatus TaxID=210409 RepID=A0A5B7DAI3_PORTR|nr:hypothetical protein [Portunus trituberculatus]